MEGERNSNKLTAEHPTVLWQVQKLAMEGEDMCSEVLRIVMHSDELRGRLGRLMRKVGRCG